MNRISHRPLQLITLGTLGLGIASYLPQVKATKIGDPLRIFAFTMGMNWFCEMLSGLCNKNENVFAIADKKWQELKDSPSVVKTLPRAMLQTALCGIVLSAAASVGTPKRLTVTSKVFTLGLPLVATFQFIAGQVFHRAIRQRNLSDSRLPRREQNSMFAVNAWVAEKHTAIAVWRIIGTVILTLSCIAIRGGLIGRTGR